MLAEPTQVIIDRTYRRLLPRLNERLRKARTPQPAAWREFQARLSAHFPRLFSLLYRVYGDQYDFFYHLEELRCT
ncbi:MAG TPA: hypothetical protein PJ988_05560, partial [Anaerolinea sp.]|nr:hypothetical protein [Anaerolinea sp.]